MRFSVTIPDGGPRKYLDPPYGISTSADWLDYFLRARHGLGPFDVLSLKCVCINGVRIRQKSK